MLNWFIFVLSSEKWHLGDIEAKKEQLKNIFMKY